MTDEQIMRGVAKSLEQIADSLAKIEQYLAPRSEGTLETVQLTLGNGHAKGSVIFPTTIFPPGTSPFNED